MTSQSCSTCRNPAVRLLGGVCQACVHPQEAPCPLGCPACAYGCPCRRCHYQPVPPLRPLPPGAPEAVAQLVAELRAEGVPVGLLRPPCRLCERPNADHPPPEYTIPGECDGYEPTEEPQALPASIEEAIDRHAGLQWQDELAASARRSLVAAIRAELDAAEQRVRERLHVEGMRAGVERLRADAPVKRYRPNAGGELWRRVDEGSSPIELRRDVPEIHPEAYRWLWVSEDDLARDWTEVTGDPRAPLLDVDLTLQQLSAALVQLDVLRRLLTTTRAELAEQRERHLEHRQDLYKALSERDAWRELATLRAPPVPSRPQVAPFCFGCGEEHWAACTCTRAGSQ